MSLVAEEPKISLKFVFFRNNAYICSVKLIEGLK